MPITSLIHNLIFNVTLVDIFCLSPLRYEYFNFGHILLRGNKYLSKSGLLSFVNYQAESFGKYLGLAIHISVLATTHTKK